MSFDEVDKAVAEGKLRRAKEILQGRLGSPDFDSELLLRYGKVLLAMGDLIEAGRMLYFSGGRDAEFREAIDLFLSRHPRSDPKRFVAGMPAMIRRQNHLAEYLASKDFDDRGWSAAALQAIEPHRVPVKRDTPSPLKQRLQNIIVAAVALAFVILLLAGVISVGKFVVSAFR